jgi:hypothetical protein
MNPEELQDIPRLLSGATEWGASAVYVLLAPKRLSRPAIVAVLALGLVVILGAEVVAGTLPLAVWGLGRATTAACVLAIVVACTRTSWPAALDLLARAWILAELVASLAWQLDQHFFAGQSWGALRGGMLAGVFAGAMAVAWVAERRNFPPGHVISADTRTAIASLAIALGTFLMSNLSFVATSTPFSGQNSREIFYIRTLVDVAGFIALYALRSQRLQLERVLELKSMSMILHTQHDQYVRSREHMDRVNARHHDLKHYIAALRREPDATIRAAIVDDLEASVQEYGEPIESGNPVVDAMLGTGLTRADREGVSVTTVVDGSVVDFVEVIDLVTIFGNAFDNAIEATRLVSEPDRRLVRIAVYGQDHFALIRFENYFGGELDLVDGLPRTTKADARHHGFGLRNIRAAVEKYDGSLTVHVEDGWFVLRILLPIS